MSQKANSRYALLMTRAQALVMAEYEEAFEKPQYGSRAPVKGSGFVRAGGATPYSTED